MNLMVTVKQKHIAIPYCTVLLVMEKHGDFRIEVWSELY